MFRKNKSYFFDDIFKRFEKEILDYIVESGREKGRSEIESHILGYLMLHQSLTQKQIIELSRGHYVKNTRSGISKGSISAVLNGIYFKIGIIKKKKVEGSKNFFKYSITRQVSRSTLENSKLGLALINDFISQNQQISKALKYIPTNDVSDLNFYNKFIKRMNDLEEFTKSYKIIMEKFISFHMKNSLDKKKQSKISVKNNSKSLEEISNKDIYILEEKLITIITKSPLFQFLKTDYIPIMGYFITREKFSQKDLKILTGYSIGHISQGLNNLLGLNVIESYKEDGARHSTYIMKSVGFSLLNRYLKAIQKSNEFKPKLYEINEELELKREKWQDLNGYYQIKEFVKDRIEMMDYYDFLEETMEEELKKFE